MKKTAAVLVLAACWLLGSLPSGAQTIPPDDKRDVPYRPGRYDAITDVPGIQVGHYTHTVGTLRGTTVVLLGGQGGLCAVDVRGGNPVTVATHTLAPLAIDVECDAIVLTGGSVFGLAAVPGVVDYLFEHGRGVETRAGRVPIVPAAVIFDLPVGDPKIHPRPEWGYKAAETAASGPVAQGNVGAGAGGTMGKTPAGVRMKGGLGTASVELPGGVVVAALVVLNPLGDVINPATSELYAVSGGFDRVPYRHSFSPPRTPKIGENTTLAVIATNARLTKTQLTKVAELAHNGLARSIRPIHSMLDGDTIFVVSMGWDKRVSMEVASPGEEVDRIGNAAADVLVRAILKGVQAAESIPGWPSYRDWLKAKEQEATQGQEEKSKRSDSPRER